MQTRIVSYATTAIKLKHLRTIRQTKRKKNRNNRRVLSSPFKRFKIPSLIRQQQKTKKKKLRRGSKFPSMKKSSLIFHASLLSSHEELICWFLLFFFFASNFVEHCIRSSCRTLSSLSPLPSGRVRRCPFSSRCFRVICAAVIDVYCSKGIIPGTGRTRARLFREVQEVGVKCRNKFTGLSRIRKNRY